MKVGLPIFAQRPTALSLRAASSESIPELDQVCLSGAPKESAQVDPKPLLAASQKTAVEAARPALFGLGGQIFADTEGRIGHLALQLGNKEFDKPLPETAKKAVLKVYQTLFQRMDPRTEFTVVVTSPEDAKRVSELAPDREGIHIVVADPEEGFSIWIRDSMLPLQREDGLTRLLVQDRSYFAGPEEQLVPYLLPEEAVAHPALRLDGGNILSNSHQAFVGIDSIDHTRERLTELHQQEPARLEPLLALYRETREQPGADLKEALPHLPQLLFETEFGKSIMVLGKDDPATEQKETQPAFHVDMMATPIGDEKFFVGDPRLAIEILEGLSPEERQRVNNSMTEAACLPPDQDLIGKLIAQNEGTENCQNYDNVATELSSDYGVTRLPVMMGQRYGHELPYLTYNNCIMEDYTGEDGARVRKVYLPQYGCEPLDKLAREAYRQEGFEVVPLDMAAITVLAGAIRCSSYAISRD